MAAQLAQLQCQWRLALPHELRLHGLLVALVHPLWELVKHVLVLRHTCPDQSLTLPSLNTPNPGKPERMLV